MYLPSAWDRCISITHHDGGGKQMSKVASAFFAGGDGVGGFVDVHVVGERGVRVRIGSVGGRGREEMGGR